MTIKKETIMFCAGGTGGHIFPALAIAKKLEKYYKIIWLGSQNGMENTLVKDYTIFNVSAVGLRGKNLKHLLLAPCKIILAILQTKKIIQQHNVKLIICMGGFVGGIGGLSTIFSQIKFIIHEQNSIAGTSNKWLNNFSYKSFQAFDGTLNNAITCGNPINFKKLAKIDISTPLNVLVLGGSLGAKTINELVPKLITKVNIWHQTGVKNLASVKKFYQKNIEKNYKIVAFIDDMASAYAWADIVIARSGAMTISELIYSQSVAILIPYPYAIDNHQVSNAKILINKNCGFMVEEKDLSREKIDEILINLEVENIIKMQNNFLKFKNKTSLLTITDTIHQFFHKSLVP